VLLIRGATPRVAVTSERLPRKQASDRWIRG